MGLGTAVSACLSAQLYGNICISKSVEQVSMKFGDHIYAPESMNPVDFSDLMSFPLALHIAKNLNFGLKISQNVISGRA